MRVVALLAVRNEELFLERCLEHLYQQGIETCIIDNGSSDASVEIAQAFIGRGVLHIENLPFNGCFDLPEILKCKEKLTQKIEADWFIHYDADEIREAPYPYRTLQEGIQDADKQGFNAINFDEFVFLPTDDSQSYEAKDYVAEMQHYYFFEPYPLRRLNAWKNTVIGVDIVSSAGHCVNFEGRKVFPINFILRHYICLSRAHAIMKYGSRVFSLNAVKDRGWSKDRVSFTPEKLHFPTHQRLKLLSDSWDKSDPWLRHESLFAYPLSASREGSTHEPNPPLDSGGRHFIDWIRRFLG
jgi:glycosyltransferase involved in cell wall biosynthesis